MENDQHSTVENSKGILGNQMTIFESSQFPFRPGVNADLKKVMMLQGADDSILDMSGYEDVDGPIGMSDTASSVRLPIFGRIHFVNDVKGLLQVTLTRYILLHEVPIT